jgi:hypothetical protein
MAARSATGDVQFQGLLLRTAPRVGKKLFQQTIGRAGVGHISPPFGLRTPASAAFGLCSWPFIEVVASRYLPLYGQSARYTDDESEDERNKENGLK